MSTFKVGGLASGLDTASIVDKLVALEQRPIQQMQARQKAFSTQLSTVADMVTKLRSLSDAAAALARTGVVASSQTGTHSQLSVTDVTGGTAGRFAVSVEQLAAAARAQSAAFDDAVTVRGGTLDISVNGTAWQVVLEDGTSLDQAATAINASGAPVRANVLFDGTRSYLAVAGLSTGHPVGSPAADALVLTETSTGLLGQPLGLATTQAARNAVLKVDGLTFERQQNVVSDAIPGVTLALSQAKPGLPEDLVLNVDKEKTAQALQRYVDAYNALHRTLAAQLTPSAGSDRDTLLVGNSAVRSLQSRLQAVGVHAVAGAGTFKTLAEIGVRTARDGSLSVDTLTLERALQRDPVSLDRMFSDATDGLAASVKELTDQYAAAGGILAQTQEAMRSSIDRLTQQQLQMADRVERYRATLEAQFAAMEQVVNSLNAVNAFLSSQEAAASKKG
ncbi:MAG: flagellar filament capping protein FliD [Deltaproteobacteria bacterium]|nr:flagellar filament capping protein FliD [Deltaproteobacteria bacterium]